MQGADQRNPQLTNQGAMNTWFPLVQLFIHFFRVDSIR
jgi:hypothetical protein